MVSTACLGIGYVTTQIQRQKFCREEMPRLLTCIMKSVCMVSLAVVLIHIFATCRELRTAHALVGDEAWVPKSKVYLQLAAELERVRREDHESRVLTQQLSLERDQLDLNVKQLQRKGTELESFSRMLKASEVCTLARDFWGKGGIAPFRSALACVSLLLQSMSLFQL